MHLIKNACTITAALVVSALNAATPFPLNEVQLKDSPYLAAKKRNAEFLLTINPDRLMARMYEFCGEKQKAPVYEGWGVFDVSGHTLGHYLSALSLEYTTTGNLECKKRIDYIVSEMARCQKLYGDSGYIGCLIPRVKKSLDLLKDGDVETINNTWAPWYTQHKIGAGLLDAWKLAGSEQARTVLLKFADWVDDLTKGLSDQQCQRMLDQEYGGIGEVFWNLYTETKDEKYITIAKRFRHHAILDDLAEGRDRLPGKHANTQVPKIVAEALCFESTKEDFARRVSENFFDLVVKKHTYATGGNSDREHFFNPADADKHLSPASVESCNVYNMIRLAEHLQQWHPVNGAYGDYRERALLNHILPSQDPERAQYTYFMSFKPGHFHVYSTPDKSFWCCFGTGMENHTKYNIGIYYHDADTVYVTQYIPSILNWKEAGFELEQTTSYPRNGKIAFTVKQAPSRPMTLHFRVPGWLKSEFTASLNGKLEKHPVSKDGISFRRVWKAGDTVNLDFPMTLYSEPLFGGHSELLAFFYGPTLLAGDLGQVEDYQNRIYLRDQFDLQNTPGKPVPMLLGDSADELTAAWKPVSGEDRAFSTKAADGTPVILRPFNQMPYQYYNVYWRYMSLAAWNAHKADLEAKAEAARQHEARIVDSMNFGEQQPENDHALKFEKSPSGRHAERGWRRADAGGFLEFRLKVRPGVRQTLECTYWGGDRGTETEILLDGKRLAVQKLNAEKPDGFFSVEYPISADMVSGKESVRIRMQGIGESSVGSIYHAAILTVKP